MRRGGPLARRTALAASAGLTRKTPMTRRRRRRTDGEPRPVREFSTTTRNLIYARDQRRCVRCGIDIAHTLWGSVQHRRGRGAGGSTLAWVHGAANGIVLCGSGTTGCHGWVESEPLVAERCGWRIERGVMTAGAWPVLYPAFGQVRLLDDLGRYRVLAAWDDDADPENDGEFSVGVFLSAGDGIV